MGDFSFEAMRRQAKHHEHVGMMEQPEDLGKTRFERIPGHQPASMWQFPPFELALREGMRTCVFSQLNCGSESVKPTRLLLKLRDPLPGIMFEGGPTFKPKVFMLPLPQREGAALIGRHQGSFRTAAAAAWPGAPCKWAAIIAAYRKYSAMQEGEGNGNKKRPLLDKENPEEAKRRQLEEEQPVDPVKPLFSGAARGAVHGRGISIRHRSRMGDLPSPGWWRRDKRRFPMSKGWRELSRRLEKVHVGGLVELEKEFFRMTRGGLPGGPTPYTGGPDSVVP